MSPKTFKLGWFLEGKEYILEYKARSRALGARDPKGKLFSFPLNGPLSL